MAQQPATPPPSSAVTLHNAPVPPSQAEREVAFCREVVRTGDPLVACVRAGIRDMNYPLEVTARRLLERADIKLVILALQKNEKRNDAIETSRASLVAEVQEIGEKALAADEFGAATNAKKLQAQLLGLLETTVNVNVKHAAEELTDAQLEAIARKSDAIDVPYEIVQDGGRGIGALGGDKDGDGTGGGGGATAPSEGPK